MKMTRGCARNAKVLKVTRARRKPPRDARLLDVLASQEDPDGDHSAETSVSKIRGVCFREIPESLRTIVESPRNPLSANPIADFDADLSHVDFDKKGARCSART